MEQLNYNLMYRWFVGLSPDDPVWGPTTFTKNRDRLQNGEVFAKFMTKLLNHPQVKPLFQQETSHFFWGWNQCGRSLIMYLPSTCSSLD
jgi:transposase